MHPSSRRGYSVIEFVMVIGLVALVGSYVAMDIGNTPESVSWEQTRAKLEGIRTAILGDDTRNAEGKRIHFGYIGDMGRIPSTLTELVTIGTQPAWAYDATVGFGYGWRGPYVAPGVSSATAVDKDEWGSTLIYNTSEPTPSIRSYAEDRMSGGNGYAKDIVVEIPQTLRLATVRGHVLDNEAELSGKTVQLSTVISGTLTNVSGSSTADGMISFSGVPFGVRALSVTTPPPIGPFQITVDKSETMISAAILNYGGKSEAVTYVANSANLMGGSAKGFSTYTVVATLKSTYRQDQKLKSFTANWSNGAKMISMTINGVKEIFSSPVAAGSRTTTVTAQIVPATSSVNNLEMTFDRSLYGQTIALEFEWANSSLVDTVSFSATPSWGLPGSLDTGFGTEGMFRTALSGNFSFGLTQTPEGKFYQTAYDGAGVSLAVYLYRFTHTGTLDTTFNSTGLYTANIWNAGSIAQGIGVLPNGSVVFGGVNANTNDFAAVRLNSNGTLDTSFHSDGLTSVNVSNNDTVNRILLQSDGKILAVGHSDLASATNNDWYLLRWTTAGLLDTSFSTSGIWVYNIGAAVSDSPRDAVIDSNGNYFVIGGNSGNKDFYIVRLLSNGIYDTAFSNDGQVSIDFSGNDTANAVLLETSGKFIVAGAVNVNKDLGFIRLLTNGELDTTFRTSGKFSQDISGNDSILDMKLGGGGTFYGFGKTGTEFLIVRYTSSGVLDTTFKSTGIYTMDVSGADNLRAGVVTPEGKVCGAGNDNNAATIRRTVLFCLWP